jgi:hypothetical protein
VASEAIRRHFPTRSLWVLERGGQCVEAVVCESLVGPWLAIRGERPDRFGRIFETGEQETIDAEAEVQRQAYLRRDLWRSGRSDCGCVNLSHACEILDCTWAGRSETCSLHFVLVERDRLRACRTCGLAWYGSERGNGGTISSI